MLACPNRQAEFRRSVDCRGRSVYRGSIASPGQDIVRTTNVLAAAFAASAQHNPPRDTPAVYIDPHGLSGHALRIGCSTCTRTALGSHPAMV